MPVEQKMLFFFLFLSSVILWREEGGQNFVRNNSAVIFPLGSLFSLLREPGLFRSLLLAPCTFSLSPNKIPKMYKQYFLCLYAAVQILPFYILQRQQNLYYNHYYNQFWDIFVQIFVVFPNEVIEPSVSLKFTKALKKNYCNVV